MEELKELWDIIDNLNEATTKLKKYYLNKFENDLLSEEDIELEKKLIEKSQ